MNEDNHVCAILAVDAPLTYVNSDAPRQVGTSQVVQNLLDNLASPGCEEFGEPRVSATVVVDDTDKVYDIRLNDESIGYFATRSYCMTYGLAMAPKLYQGEFNSDQLKDIAETRNVLIIPLF